MGNSRGCDAIDAIDAIDANNATIQGRNRA
jgi:hypothetical protein